jgi:lipopolysaccharide export system permease protein
MNQTDTLLKQRMGYYSFLHNYLKRYYNLNFLPDTNLKVVTTAHPISNFYESLPQKNRTKIAEQAFTLAQDVRSNIISTTRDVGYSKENMARFDIEIQHKFSYSFACLMLIIMGGALGAIIRKGGLGLPLVVAVSFFVVFHVSNMTGQKFAEGMKIPVWLGCWMPLIVLFPVALWVVDKARQDALIFLSRDSIIHKFYTIKWIPKFMKPKFIFKNYYQ